MIIVDSSIICDFLLNSEIYPELADFVTSQDGLAAPDLLQYEAGSVMRRLFLAGKLTNSRARDALGTLASLNVDYRTAEPLLLRMWDLRHNISFYDASYVALAESTGLPLYTRDLRLASAPGHSANIIVV